MIDDYDHVITGEGSDNGVRTYTIKSTPKPDAPVVWGRVEMEIREDGIMIAQRFLDQDFQAVKILNTSDIQPVGDKKFPMRWTMRNLEEHDRFTELIYKELEFDVKVSDRMFSTTYMKNLAE